MTRVLLLLVVGACGGTAPAAHQTPATRVLVRGVLAYAVATDGTASSALWSVELGERFELVARDAGGAAHRRVTLGPADYDHDDLAIADGRAWVTSRRGTVRAFDVQTGALVHRWHLGAAATAVAASADGRHLVTGTASGVVCLRRLPDGALLQCVRAHDGPVSGLALSDDGARLASSAWDGTVAVWSMPALAPLGRRRSAGSINDVAFAPDGRIVTAHSTTPPVLRPGDRRRLPGPGHVELGPVGGPARVCGRHEAPVTSVAVSPDGRHLASGSWDRTVRVWSAHTCRQITRTALHQQVRDVSFVSNQMVAAAAWISDLQDPALVLVHVLYTRSGVGWGPRP